MEVNSYEIEIHVVVIASSQDLLRRIFETLNRKVVLLGEQGGALKSTETPAMPFQAAGGKDAIAPRMLRSEQL